MLRVVLFLAVICGFFASYVLGSYQAKERVLSFGVDSTQPSKGDDAMQLQECDFGGKLEVTQSYSDSDNVYSIVLFEKKDESTYRFFARQARWYSGEEAIDVAVRETGCPRDIITYGMCAPSLNNGFYISNGSSIVEQLVLSQNTRVIILRDNQETAISVEEFYNLYTQTDAFGSGDYKTYFTIELEGNSILQIKQVYVP